MDFVQELLTWYRSKKRNLPWRATKDPYKVWLSEIILQQTRVEQGLAYYHAFLEHYPDVHALAKAGEDRVLKTWEGLGYYSRARNLHATAKRISEEMGGRFPQTHAGLLQLKGIGDYTASAISSICFNEAQPVVDGNVYRFLSRYFGIKTPIDSTKGKKQFRQIAEELIPKKDPGTFNQAMMEFGARQCKPGNPNCEECPFRLSCVALKKKLVKKLPVKEKKTKVRERFFYYLVLQNGSHTFIRQRTENDIWKGLFEFPLAAFDSPPQRAGAPSDKAVRNKTLKTLAGNLDMRIKFVSGPILHILSHQKLNIVFVRGEVKGKANIKNFKRVRIEDLNNYAFPIVLKKNITFLFTPEISTAKAQRRRGTAK